MIGATALFVIGDSFMKLVTQDLPPFEVLALRGVAACLTCAALVVMRGEWRMIGGALERSALLRAAGETLSTLCYIVALARMQIADVIAILQTAPLMLLLGAAVLFREPVGYERALYVLAGFAGALMVAQPGLSGVSSVTLLAFGAAVFIAARDLVGRRVPRRIPVTVVIFATMVMETVAAAAMSFGFEAVASPSGRHVAFLGVAALFVTLGHVGLIVAYRRARATVIAPFFYSFALWGVLAGLVVWGVVPNAVTLAGIALIIVSGVALIWVDERLRRAALPLANAA